jgi:hypothetical protein
MSYAGGTSVKPAFKEVCNSKIKQSGFVERNIVELARVTSCPKEMT